MDINGNIIKREVGWRDFWQWRLRSGAYKAERGQPWPVTLPSMPKDFPLPQQRSEKLQITFINHATFLLQAAGINIITDPVFADCAGPLGKFGPRRVLPPGVQFADLPKIDYILLTHNHYDHMDIGSIRQLVKRDNPLIITGINNGYYLRNTKGRVKELNWGDMHAAEAMQVHYLRCKHWSHRWPFDQNWALWGAFAIEIAGKKIYFAGDTAYFDHFKEAGTRFGGFDVSILPIGAYKPRIFMQYAHNSPEEAVLAHVELQSKLSIAMHFGTFNLSDEGYDEPLNDLQAAIRKHAVAPEAFISLHHGEGRVVA